MKIIEKMKMLKSIETMRENALDEIKKVKAASIYFNTKLNSGGQAPIEDVHMVGKKVISVEKAYRSFVEEYWTARSQIENGRQDQTIIEYLGKKLGEFTEFANRSEQEILDKANAIFSL